MAKYKIVSLSDDGVVDFYGAEVGDIVEIDTKHNDLYGGNVWCKGSDVFKESGWTGFRRYCVCDNMKDFLPFVEEIV